MIRASSAPEKWKGATSLLENEIASALKLVDRFTAKPRDRLRRLTSPASAVTALELVERQTLVVINTNLSDAHRAPVTEAELLSPGEVRVVPAPEGNPVIAKKSSGSVALRAAASEPRIVIENLSPRVTGGPFPAKRIVGQKVTVEADAYMDGHDVLAVALLWKAADQEEWHRLPMSPLGNAKWEAAFTPDRIGCWQFTIEASLDEYATLCRAIRLKREAGVDISVELAEMRLALEAAIARKTCTRTALADVLSVLAKGDRDAGLEALTSSRTVEIVGEAGGHAFTVQHEPLAIEVDRRGSGLRQLVRALSAFAD